ncbi:MAG: SusF/SusE family outer membrane protein [Bacteroidota bacterium]
MNLRLLLTVLLTSVISLGNAQITSVGIIGSATPMGWDADTDMTQDPNDTAVWTINIDLTDGAVKFRANDDWAINWGFTDFPTGVGIQDGPDIPVVAGNYDVSFNHVTGVYSFSFESPIGIIGSATPGGWDNDTDMFYSEAEGLFFITLDLVVGAAKFRQDNDWAINWGGDGFPSGIGTQDGPDIMVPTAGTYYITLDTASGEYNFAEQISFESVGIIGDATPGGWDNDTDLWRDTNDPNLWFSFLNLTDGLAKFRADDDWVINWGSMDFPIGVGVQGGDDIPITAGFYRIDFNSETGDYSFTELGNFTSVGIIGPATPGGWTEDTDMIQDQIDPSIWRISIELTDGEAKFRADDDWAINWGGPDFPIGVAVQDGADIPVTAGEYNITFNTLTGEYEFEEFVVYDEISLVGEAGPFGDWPEPDDMGARDTYLNVDADDDQMWTLAGVTLTDAADGGGVKFRANTDWAVNWGAADFPGGTGTQDGDNILCVAGTYDVSFNSLNGEYLFSDPNSTEEVLLPSVVQVFPNPVIQILNVNLEELNVSGQATVTVFDMQGKVMKQNKRQLSNSISIDVSALNSGNYLLNISNSEFTVGKRFSIIK